MNREQALKLMGMNFEELGDHLDNSIQQKIENLKVIPLHPEVYEIMLDIYRHMRLYCAILALRDNFAFNKSSVVSNAIQGMVRVLANDKQKEEIFRIINTMSAEFIATQMREIEDMPGELEPEVLKKMEEIMREQGAIL
jgi:hypothetical protein